MCGDFNHFSASEMSSQPCVCVYCLFIRIPTSDGMLLLQLFSLGSVNNLKHFNSETNITAKNMSIREKEEEE